MNDTDFTYLYFLSFECLNGFYSTQMECPRRDCCSFKEEYTEAWKDGKKMWKSCLMIFTGLLPGENPDFPALYLIFPTSLKLQWIVFFIVRWLKGILFYLFYFPSVLNEKPLHPFINTTKGMFLNWMNTPTSEGIKFLLLNLYIRFPCQQCFTLAPAISLYSCPCF